MVRAKDTQTCSEKRKEARPQYRDLTQSLRSTNAGEEALRLGFWQSKTALIQAILTVMALAATAWAAWAAADAARAAKASVDDARKDAEEQVRRFNAQLKVAKDAADAAAKGANAAIALVETSRLNNIGDLRAYVTLEEINIKLMWNHPGANGELIGYVFDCVWRNGGKSPAVNVVAAVNEAHGNGGRPPLDDFGFPDFEGYDPTKLTIGPHGHIIMPVRIDAHRMHQRPDDFTFIYGWIEYDDIVGSGERHRTEFCHEIVRAPHLSENPVVLLKTGPFNGIDKTCHHKPKS